MVAPAKQEEEIRAICSACYQTVPLEQTHVIPCFNEILNAYVTSYRCGKCWGPSLAETRARLEGPVNEDEIETGAMFFQRYGVIVPEHIRRDPAKLVRAALVKLVDRLRDGDLKLAIGPAISLDPMKLKSFLNPEG